MASDYFQQVANLSDENETKVKGMLLMNRYIIIFILWSIKYMV